MKKKEQPATQLVLVYWTKKLDKSMKALAMAFEDHAEAHQNVIQVLGLLLKEHEAELAKLKGEKAKVKKK